MNQELVEKFEKLLLETKRTGIENLLEFIRKSDFYTAPASTRFHGAWLVSDRVYKQRGSEVNDTA